MSEPTKDIFPTKTGRSHCVVGFVISTFSDKVEWVEGIITIKVNLLVSRTFLYKFATDETKNLVERISALRHLSSERLSIDINGKPTSLEDFVREGDIFNVQYELPTSASIDLENSATDFAQEACTNCDCNADVRSSDCLTRPQSEHIENVRVSPKVSLSVELQLQRLFDENSTDRGLDEVARLTRDLPQYSIYEIGSSTNRQHAPSSQPYDGNVINTQTRRRVHAFELPTSNRTLTSQFQDLELSSINSSAEMIRSRSSLMFSAPIAMDIYLSLCLCPDWKLTMTSPLPERMEGSGTANWRFNLDRTGMLEYGNEVCSCVSWETISMESGGGGGAARCLPSFIPSRPQLFSPPMMTLTVSDFVERYLPSELVKLGLHKGQIEELLTHFEPDLGGHPLITFRFLSPREINRASQLSIFPAPDYIIRIFLLMGPGKVVSHGNIDWRETLWLKGDHYKNKAAFRVVEWGFMEVPSDIIEEANTARSSSTILQSTSDEDFLQSSLHQSAMDFGLFTASSEITDIQQLFSSFDQDNIYFSNSVLTKGSCRDFITRKSLGVYDTNHAVLQSEIMTWPNHVQRNYTFSSALPEDTVNPISFTSNTVITHTKFRHTSIQSEPKTPLNLIPDSSPHTDLNTVNIGCYSSDDDCSSQGEGEDSTEMATIKSKLLSLMDTDLMAKLSAHICLAPQTAVTEDLRKLLNQPEVKTQQELEERVSKVQSVLQRTIVGAPESLRQSIIQTHRILHSQGTLQQTSQSSTCPPKDELVAQWKFNGDALIEAMRKEGFLSLTNSTRKKATSSHSHKKLLSPINFS